MKAKKFSREELYKLVWSKPATKLSKDLGISDCAITKLCRRHKVPKPWPGYWNEVRPVIPRLPPPPAGAPDEIVIRPLPKYAFRQHTLRLIENEKQDASRISVSPTLRGAHPLVLESRAILERSQADDYGRLRPRAFSGDQQPPCLMKVSKKVLPRGLRIMDALLKASEARGFQFPVGSRSKIIVEGRAIAFYLWEGADRIRIKKDELSHLEGHREWIFKPNGRLIFEIDLPTLPRKRWQDNRTTLLEDQLNDIMIGFYSASEIICQQKSAEVLAKRRKERQRRAMEDQRLREQWEHLRLQDLERHLKLWANSRNLKLFLKDFTEAVRKTDLVDDGSAAEWLAWASGHATSVENSRKALLQNFLTQLRNEAQTDTQRPSSELSLVTKLV
jgi:hypothetical protein